MAKAFKITFKKGTASDVVYLHDNGDIEWEKTDLLTSTPYSADMLANTHKAMDHGAKFLKSCSLDSYEIETVT